MPDGLKTSSQGKVGTYFTCITSQAFLCFGLKNSLNDRYSLTAIQGFLCLASSEHSSGLARSRLVLPKGDVYPSHISNAERFRPFAYALHTSFCLRRSDDMLSPESLWEHVLFIQHESSLGRTKLSSLRAVPLKSFVSTSCQLRVRRSSFQKHPPLLL